MVNRLKRPEMNKEKMRFLLLYTIIFFSSFFQTSCSENILSAHQWPKVLSVEFAEYGKEEYSQINNTDEFINIIKTAKKIPAKFFPNQIIRITLDDGQIFFVYMDRTCRFFKINGTTYMLKRKESNKLSRLLNHSNSVCL